MRQNVPLLSARTPASAFSCVTYESSLWTSACVFISRPAPYNRAVPMKTTTTSFVSVLVLLGTSAWGNDHKLSPELKGRHTAGAVDVIVQFKVAPAQKHRDRIAAHGGLVKQHLRTIKGFLVSLPASRVG